MGRGVKVFYRALRSAPQQVADLSDCCYSRSRTRRGVEKVNKCRPSANSNYNTRTCRVLRLTGTLMYCSGVLIQLLQFQPRRPRLTVSHKNITAYCTASVNRYVDCTSLALRVCILYMKCGQIYNLAFISRKIEALLHRGNGIAGHLLVIPVRVFIYRPSLRSCVDGFNIRA